MKVKLVGIKRGHFVEAECGSCKHWKWGGEPDGPGDIYYCTAIKAPDRDHMDYVQAQIVTKDSHGSNVLATSKYFGCTLWEPPR